MANFSVIWEHVRSAPDQFAPRFLRSFTTDRVSQTTPGVVGTPPSGAPDSPSPG